MRFLPRTFEFSFGYLFISFYSFEFTIAHSEILELRILFTVHLTIYEYREEEKKGQKEESIFESLKLKIVAIKTAAGAT